MASAEMISIVIPTWRRSGLLAGALASLAGESGADFEAIVVVDGPDEASARLARTNVSPFPVRWIFHGRNEGRAAARNSGARVAAGEILLFIDDDVAVRPGWLAAHAGHHHSGENLVVLGRLRHKYPVQPRSRTEAWLRELAALENEYLERALEQIDSARSQLWIGLNCSLPRRIFLEHGGMDEHLRQVQEDAELAARLLAAGVRFVYEPDALIEHRSTHDLVAQHLARAARFGASDVYRIRDLGQRAAADPAFNSMFSSPLASRLKQRVAWHAPGLTQRIAEVSRFFGEITTLPLFFREWHELSFACRYWREIRSLGLDLDGIRRLALAGGCQQQLV